MKIIFLFLIGVVAVVLFSMPETMESTSGVHDIDASDCVDCHEDKKPGSPVMAEIACTGCHEFRDGHTVHTIICITCHPVTETLYDSMESHRDITYRAFESSLMGGENEACFLCHSDIRVQFNMSRPVFIEFNVSVQDKDWLIQDLVVGPPVSYWISSKGEGRNHQWISASEVECTSCHSDITTDPHFPPQHSGNRCDYCHFRSATQHASRDISCTGRCHVDHKGNLFSQVAEHSHQSRICMGCHNDDPARLPAGKTGRIRVFYTRNIPDKT